jgi:uncharacterized protein (DUF58 family)
MHNLFWSVLILFAVAALLRMDWVYYLVYVVGGVWIFSHIWVRRSLGRIQSERTLPGRAFAGEVIVAQVRLRNRSWLPIPWLQIQDAIPLELKDQPDYRTVVSVGGHSTYDYTYRLQCKRRGYYAVGPLSLRSSDIFGFVDARWDELEPRRLIVYPRVLSLEQIGLPSRAPFGSLPSPHRLQEDPARLAGVRAYASGDSQRRIHWKATAHADTLLVKKFQPSLALPVAVVLDLNRAAYPVRTFSGDSEWAITVAASLANYVVQKRQPVGFVSNGFDALLNDLAGPLPPRTGHEHLMAVLSLLARIQLTEKTEALATWLPVHTARLPWGTTLLAVMPVVDEPTLWVLHAARRRGASVMGLVCARQPDFRTIQAHAQRLGIALHSILWDSDLEQL